MRPPPPKSPLWGLGRAAAMENPEFHTRLIDLDPAESASDSAARLAAELHAGGDEDQIAYRRGERLVPRLMPAADMLATAQASGRELTVPSDGPMRLRLGATGSFDGLNYEGFSRRAPGPGQVEIEVRAAGLNFSDVLKAMGLYPGITDEIVPLGIECVGRGDGGRRRRRRGSTSAMRCWASPRTASPRMPSPPSTPWCRKPPTSTDDEAAARSRSRS